MTPTWTLVICLLGAILQQFMPRTEPKFARATALLTAFLSLAAAFSGVVNGMDPGVFTTLTRAPWVPGLGIEFHLAADGITHCMLVLTGIAAVAGVLFSWNVEHRVRDFFSLYFLLLTGCFGVFLSADLFLLFVFYELAIVPKYLLIAHWGSKNREHGAMKLALYSFVGSALVFAGILACAWASGVGSFSLQELGKHAFPPDFQRWVFPLLFVGFAVLAGMFPFHTWAPTGHSAAPTAASMLLAGVVMKLGAYGALRAGVALMPQGAAMWQMPLGMLAAIGIVHGAWVALTQRDIKYIIGYSSVSHMGFALLGLLSLSSAGLSGAVLQMFSHGIIGGLLFAIAGRMIYDRTHTRELAELEGLNLQKLMPFAAVSFVLAGFASMGMPGFSGFAAEAHVLAGAWKSFPSLAILSGVGIVLGAAFTLRVVHRTFYAAGAGEVEPSPASTKEKQAHGEALVISIPERLGAMGLIAVALAVGLWPRLLLDWIVPALESPLFENLRKSGGLQ
ncbi:MAG: NADH-quinone oxidoreductase subunit M [Verrucomicrobia bacterium]|nr:NADH-quinone oxidoreductase subunit M [Verrucomicrobiota bacterium]